MMCFSFGRGTGGSYASFWIGEGHSWIWRHSFHVAFDIFLVLHSGRRTLAQLRMMGVVEGRSIPT